MLDDFLDGRELKNAAFLLNGVKGAEDASEQVCIFWALLERNKILFQRREVLGALNDGLSNRLSIFSANSSHDQVAARFADTNRAHQCPMGVFSNIGISLRFFQPAENERPDLCGNRGDLTATMRREVRPDLFEPKIADFLCNMCTYAGADKGAP